MVPRWGATCARPRHPHPQGHPMSRPDIDSIRARATEAATWTAVPPVRASLDDVPVLLAYVVEVEQENVSLRGSQARAQKALGDRQSADLTNDLRLVEEVTRLADAERDAALSRVAELEGLVSALRCPPSLRHLGADALAAWMLGSG